MHCEDLTRLEAPMLLDFSPSRAASRQADFAIRQRRADRDTGDDLLRAPTFSSPRKHLDYQRFGVLLLDNDFGCLLSLARRRSLLSRTLANGRVGPSKDLHPSEEHCWAF